MTPATVEELRDLDRKFYEMLSALPRVQQSDGGVEGHARYAEQPSKALGCRTRETSSAPTTEAVAGIKPCPSDLKAA